MSLHDHRPIALVMALRKQGITDATVLSAIERTPREVFVDAPFAHAAYDNTALPIACGQTISQPYVVAYATEALEIGPPCGCWRSARARAIRPRCSRRSAARSTRSSATSRCCARPRPASRR